MDDKGLHRDPGDWVSLRALEDTKMKLCDSDNPMNERSVKMLICVNGNTV